VPRTVHAQWVCPIDLPNPIELLKHADRGRLPELLPIRYGRMGQSPFAFLRGAGALMARDLAAAPKTGIRVQACGDCHTSDNDLERSLMTMSMSRAGDSHGPSDCLRLAFE
jgi:Uncharacterized protein conserved in bacteria (DUF2252)